MMMEYVGYISPEKDIRDRLDLTYIMERDFNTDKAFKNGVPCKQGLQDFDIFVREFVDNIKGNYIIATTDPSYTHFYRLNIEKSFVNIDKDITIKGVLSQEDGRRRQTEMMQKCNKIKLHLPEYDLREESFSYIVDLLYFLNPEKLLEKIINDLCTSRDN